MEENNEEGKMSSGMYLIGRNGIRKVTSKSELSPRERWMLGVSEDVEKNTVPEVATDLEVESDEGSDL